MFVPDIFGKSHKAMNLLSIFISMGLCSALLRLAWIDWRTLRLPDVYTFPLLAAGLVVAVTDIGVGLPASAIGGAIGFALFWIVGRLHFVRRGVEGLGLGDAKLFAASGTWLGFALLPYVLLVASLCGLAFAVLRRPAAGAQIPFGPWLTLGFFLTWMALQLEVLG